MIVRHSGKRTPSLIARRLLMFAVVLQFGALLAIGLPTIRLIATELPPLLNSAPPGFLRSWLHDCLLDVGVVLLMSMLVAWQLIQFAVSVLLSGPMTLLSRLMTRVAQGDFTHIASQGASDELGRYIAKANALIVRAARGVKPRLLHWEGEPVPFIRLAFFIVVFADSLCYSFLPVYARDLYHAQDAESARLAASLPISVFWMVVAAVQLTAGRRLAPQIRKGAFLIGILLLAVGLEGCASAETLMSLVLWRALCGIGVGIGMALTQDFMLAGLGGQGRTYAAALYLATYFSGAVCGTSIGSILAGHTRYQGTLLLAAILASTALAPVLWARIGQPADAAPGGLPAETTNRLRRLARNGRFLSVVLLAALPSRFLMSAFLYYLIPLYLAELGTSRSEIARVIMIYSLIMALAGPALGQLADRFGRPFPLVLAGMLLSAAAPPLAVLMPTPLGIGLALGLLGIAHAFGLSSQVALLLSVTTEECRQLGNAAVVGLYRVSERVGTVIGPLLVALLVTRWDYPGGMIGIGAVVLAASALLSMTFMLAGLAGRLRRILPAAGLALLLGLHGPAQSAPPPLKVAVAVALTNNQTNQGEDIRRAAEMASEDANADPALSADGAPPIELAAIDDGGSPNGARAVAQRLADSDTLAVIGPLYSAQLSASAPVYQAAGLVALSPTAHVDRIADSATTFRGVYDTGTMGEAFADYLHYALGIDKAVVLRRNDDYGRLIAEGFKRGADRLCITTEDHSFEDETQSAALAARLAAVSGGRAVVVAALQDDAVPLLMALRRAGWRGPVLATDSLARDNFVERFKDAPEEQDHRGYFLEGLYVAAPTILDTVGADTLAFAQRFESRFRHFPNWDAVATYESGRVLMTAVRLSAGSGATSVAERRRAVQAQLVRLDGPEPVRDGPPGRPWFEAGRGRHLPIRLGRFHDGRIESAPLQLVAGTHAGPEEIASGALIAVADGYAQLQRVVYAGLYLNDVSELDTARGSFKADFYVWLRYVEDHRAGAMDPLDIDFPDLIGRPADAIHPVEQRILPDGTVYRLLHVRSTFRSDFDVHRYPFDSQRLKISFFNGRAASDRIIYALDQRSPTVATQMQLQQSHLADGDSPFRNLTEWSVAAASAGRHLLVTDSALGDPQLAGAERRRELSGFRVTIELRRRLIAVLAKVLLPLALMTLILLASHFFAGDLARHRIDVAITGVLSGIVLLTAINSQLGNYGYTMEVEYIFYVFFFLCFLSITGTAVAEGFRLIGLSAAARRTALTVRYMSILVVLSTVLIALIDNCL